MRKPIIVGNWKMFKTRDEALQFILKVNNNMPSNEKVDSVTVITTVSGNFIFAFTVSI